MDLIKFQVYSLVKKDNKNCRWSAEEDELLKKLVQYSFVYKGNKSEKRSNGAIFRRNFFLLAPKVSSEMQSSAEKDG